MALTLNKDVSAYQTLASPDSACLCLTHTDTLILVECSCSVVKRAGLGLVGSTVRGGGGGGGDRRRGEVVGSAVVAWD